MTCRKTYKRKRNRDDDDVSRAPSSRSWVSAIITAILLTSAPTNCRAFHQPQHSFGIPKPVASFQQQRRRPQRSSTASRTISYHHRRFLFATVIDGEEETIPHHLHCDDSTTVSPRSSLVLVENNEGRYLEENEPQDVSTAAASVFQLPPWLERYQSTKAEQVQVDVEWLEGALLGQYRFAASDVSDIVKAIYIACHGDVPKIIGCVEFCKLLLRLDDDTPSYGHHHHHHHDALAGEAATSPTTTTGRKATHSFVSKDVLLASILHYAECVSARYDGLYERMHNVISSSGSATSSVKASSPSPVLSMSSSLRQLDVVDMAQEQGGSSSMSLRSRLSKDDHRPLDIFTADSLRLAQGASRIKRAEILATIMLSDNRPFQNGAYDDIRDLLVSLSDDWRALAIRCAASLYRLEGVLEATVSSGTGEYLKHKSQEATLTARDSLRVYATLAQRLGLHRLKAQLEGSSFRILYPRQYSAASTLFQQHGAAMEAISNFLCSQLTQLLYEDSSLMYELEDLQVVSRVKEPYSFWKKLLRKRLAPGDVDSTAESRSLARPSQALSVLEINDGVAMRVILKARKLDPDESNETTRSRERMLCYYVQRLVRSQWPEVDASRVKDYIRSPKPNGYQSLHHTSKITRNGQEFFFEVQIRSHEMHQLAEFGVAAHWTYKLDRTLPALAPSPLSSIEMSRESKGRGPLSMDESTIVDVVDSPLNEDVENTTIGVIAAAESASYIHALQEARRSLMESHVYVFLAGSSSSSLESGQLLTLEAGSLIADVVNSLFDNGRLSYTTQEVQVWKNGKLALLNEPVRNGDMLLVEHVMNKERSKEMTTVQ